MKLENLVGRVFFYPDIVAYMDTVSGLPEVAISLPLPDAQTGNATVHGGRTKQFARHKNCHL